MQKKQIWALIVSVVLGVVLGVGGAATWVYLQPRTIAVAVFPDYSYRQRADWREVLQKRIAAVSRTFEDQTGIKWKFAGFVTEDRVNGFSGTLDARRAYLAADRQYAADVLLIVTASTAAGRSGSVMPFSHALLIVDAAGKPEEYNELLLEQECAALFGAAIEPESTSVMAPTPANSRLSSRSAALIRRLQKYDFAHGIDALPGSWERTATAALTEAYRGHDPNPAARANQVLAASFRADGRNANSIPHLREVVRLELGKLDARLELAQALLQDSRTDEGVGILRTAIHEQPDNARLHSLLADALTNIDREQALDEYAEAVRLEPKSAAMQTAYGEALLNSEGRLDAARAAFANALRIDPSNLRALDGLARVNGTLEEARADIDSLRRFASTTRNTKAALYQLGLAEIRAGDLEGAVRDFQRLLQLDPRYGPGYSGLAAVAYVRGDYRAAWAELDRGKSIGVRPPLEFAAALQRKAPR